MTRLILLIILALVTWIYFPETRAMLLDAAEPIVLPVQRWSSREEMAQLGRHVLDHERLTGEIPSGAAWLGWLDFRYASDEAARDPWGTYYQLLVWDDSVAIVSYGPDRTRLTEDDFQVVTPRN
jgi:hypothetical protein